MNGWVKLHRKLLENVELMNDDTAFLVFVKLLLLSNSKGEIGTSGRQLAKKLKLNHSTLYKILKRLEEYNAIQQISKHRYTLILICNWQKYQETGKHFGKQFLTDENILSGKRPRKRTVNTGETDGKQTTGVARIENKNKEEIKDFRGIESPAKEALRKKLNAKRK